jgi:hypothetical protein
MTKKVSFSSASRVLFWTSLTALFLVPLASAQVQTAPPTWNSEAAPLQCGQTVLFIRLYGLGRCQPALEGAHAQVEQYFASCPSRTDTVVRDCGPSYTVVDNFVCVPGAVYARGSWHPAHEPVNTVSGAGCFDTGAGAECPDRSVPLTDPAKGVYCPRSTFEAMKNLGDCPGCKVGNPISPGIGNKVQREVDYVGSGPFPLRFERVFNSYTPSVYAPRTDRSGLSVFWTHNYHRRLTLGGPAEGAVIHAMADRPDGRLFAFSLDGSVLVPDADVNLRLEQTAGGWSESSGSYAGAELFSRRQARKRDRCFRSQLELPLQHSPPH